MFADKAPKNCGHWQHLCESAFYFPGCTVEKSVLSADEWVKLIFAS